MKNFFLKKQRFGGHLGRYLVLMETKPKKLNKSLWNEDGLPKYNLWLVMPNLGLWDLTTIIPKTKYIIPKAPIGLGWVESCKQPCQTYYLFCKVYYLPQRNLTSHNCRINQKQRVRTQYLQSIPMIWAKEIRYQWFVQVGDDLLGISLFGKCSQFSSLEWYWVYYSQKITAAICFSNNCLWMGPVYLFIYLFYYYY